MSTIAELTAKVDQLQNQVKDLQRHTNVAVEGPIIHDFYHCGTCNTSFPSWNQRASHPCLPGVQAAKDEEMRKFEEMLANEVNEPQVRQIRFVNTPQGFSVPEQEAIAMAESKDRRKRVSLEAHDRAVGPTK